MVSSLVTRSPAALQAAAKSLISGVFNSGDYAALGTSNAQFWPDELLQRYGSRTNVPTGAIGKLDGPHQDLHFRVCRNRLAQFRQCLANSLIEGGNLRPTHRTRVVSEPEEVESAFHRCAFGNGNGARHSSIVPFCVRLVYHMLILAFDATYHT